MTPRYVTADFAIKASPPIAFKDVAPVVPVRDLQAALERYRQLGFEVRAYGYGTLRSAGARNS